jgi:hypothetical protein
MIITMNLITNNYGGGDTLCVGSCSATTGNFITTKINPSYYGDPNYTSTSNTALRSIDPFTRNEGVSQSSGDGSMKARRVTALNTPWYSNITYPYSGSPLTIIPSLSATTCDWGGNDGFYKFSGETWNILNGCESASWVPRRYPTYAGDPALVENPVGIWSQNYTEYTAVRTDVNDPRSFDIYVGNYLNSPTSFPSSIAVLIYRQVGTNPPIIYDPNYFV